MLLSADDRTANVRGIAARITKQGEGLSVREFLDGSALAAGTLIRTIHRGPAAEIAIRRYCEALILAVSKGAPV